MMENNHLTSFSTTNLCMVRAQIQGLVFKTKKLLVQGRFFLSVGFVVQVDTLKLEHGFIGETFENHRVYFTWEKKPSLHV